jgi:hypothetical protein
VCSSDLLSRPAEARRRGEAARHAVLEERSIEAMVRRHEEFYGRATAARAAGEPPNAARGEGT